MMYAAGVPPDACFVWATGNSEVGLLYVVMASILAAGALAFVAMRALVLPLQPMAPHLPPLTESQRALCGNLEQHVRGVASAPHNIAHPHELESAALYIEDVLTQMGHHVRWQVFEVDGVSVRNIEVVIEPAKAATKTLVIGAHYDSDADSPGANDNGTGVAALLELARLFKINPPEIAYRLRLVFFVNEEQPYGKTDNMGSLRHAKALAQSGEKILGMIALETLGYFSQTKGSQRLPFPFNWIYSDRGNFVAFIALPGSRRFLHKSVAAFRESKAFPATGTMVPASFVGADLSDHWSYHQIGVPALMITDTALYRNPFYHQPFDTPDTVDYPNLARIVEGMDAMARALAV